jgi:hypothetical protein
MFSRRYKIVQKKGAGVEAGSLLAPRSSYGSGDSFISRNVPVVPAAEFRRFSGGNPVVSG